MHFERLNAFQNAKNYIFNTLFLSGLIKVIIVNVFSTKYCIYSIYSDRSQLSDIENG